MNKAQLGVIAVSLFFILSIIAGSFIYKYPEVNNPSEESPDVNPLALDMQASGVPAKVVLPLPRLQLIAQTSETNINAIDSSLYSIAGVEGIASRFILPGQTDVSTGVTYVAEIQFSSETSAGQLLPLIEEQGIFWDIEVFPYALVEVPEKIEFISPDLNISRDYSLRDNEAMALVSLQTLQGDELEIEIDATFVGSDATNVFAFETQNISATPRYHETTLEAEISSLEPRLLLDVTAEYSQLNLLDTVEHRIASMKGIEDANLVKPELEAKISLAGDANVSDEKASDLNSFLHSLSNDVIFYNNGFFRASLFFEQGTELLPIEASIKERLASFGLNEIALQEPLGHAEGTALLETSDSSAVMPAIKDLLEGNGFAEFSLQQLGQISLAEVTTDAGSTYAIESGLVEAFFTKPHAVGETVQLDVSYYILRGKIDSIGAAEAE